MYFTTRNMFLSLYEYKTNVGHIQRIINYKRFVTNTSNLSIHLMTLCHEYVSFLDTT